MIIRLLYRALIRPIIAASVRHFLDQPGNRDLLAALRELVALGLATFLFEPRYGDLPAVPPASMTADEFDSCWMRCFADGVSGTPESNRTLFVECTERLVDELAKEEYSRYEA